MSVGIATTSPRRAGRDAASTSGRAGARSRGSSPSRNRGIGRQGRRGRRRPRRTRASTGHWRTSHRCDAPCSTRSTPPGASHASRSRQTLDAANPAARRRRRRRPAHRAARSRALAPSQRRAPRRRRRADSATTSGRPRPQRAGPARRTTTTDERDVASAVLARVGAGDTRARSCRLVDARASRASRASQLVRRSDAEPIAPEPHPRSHDDQRRAIRRRTRRPGRARRAPRSRGAG